MSETFERLPALDGYLIYAAICAKQKELADFKIQPDHPMYAEVAKWNRAYERIANLTPKLYVRVNERGEIL